MKTTLSLLATFALAPGLCAAELQGAARALERINAAAAAPPAAPPPNPAKLFRERVNAFRDEAAKLAPDEAATRWLALVDAYLALPSNVRFSRDEGFSYDSLGFAALLRALPPPPAWEVLAAALDQRKATPENAYSEYGLRLLAAALRGDQAAGNRALAALPKIKPGDRGPAAPAQGAVQSVRQWLAGDDSKQIVAQFEQRLAILEKSSKAGGSPQDASDASSYDGRGGLAVPDLVTLAGPAKARDLLRRALLLPVRVSVEIGDETRKLAARLALENAARLKNAPWKLVESLDDLALFEALDKRFPFVAADSDNDRSSAEIVYLLGLIAAHRTADATKFALVIGDHEKGGHGVSLTGAAFQALTHAGHAPALLAFLQALLGAHPELPYWESFIEVAAHTGRSADAVTAIRAALAREGLAGPVRHRLRTYRVSALLANDEVDEAVSLIRALLAEKPEDAQAPRKADHPATGAIDKVLDPLNFLPPDVHLQLQAQSDHDPLDERRRVASEFVELGQRLAHPEWIEEGLRIVHEALPALSPQNPSSRHYELRRYADLCLDTDRLAEAEETLIQNLEEILASNLAEYRDNSEWPDNLTELARFYERTGRPQDVLTLLDQSPKWGARDVSELLADDQLNHTGKPIGYIVASALAATGHVAEARRIVEAILPEHAGSDRLYELWFKLGGDGLPQKLDALYALDRFEERPLIWKAQWLLDAGQLEEAEKTARAAIAIDPSDGEQGKGDRLRAYAVLAAVLEKRGDADQAKTLRGAVEAIRISENADDFAGAGLFTHAVKMYEDALTHFADAYCIQSRLAIRFAELGQMDKAEEHYRRAYELMPGSFGRVESHCFGCEGAFSGERAQGIAEKVFTKLAVEMPEKAQVFYLLGYLREQQERYPEALAQYRQAVRLDPDYLNAWKNLGGLGEHLALPRADRDAVSTNLFRLDPFGRHGGGVSRLNDVLDLHAVWTATAAIHPLPSIPAELYPLAASKAELVKLAALPGAENAGRRTTWSFRSSDRFSSPGEVLARHQLLNTIAQIIEAGARED